MASYIQCVLPACRARTRGSTFNDPLGRVTTQWTCIPSQCGWTTLPVTAGYNLDGSLAWLQQPSGRRVTYTVDTASRLLTAKDLANSVDYVTNTTYHAHGPEYQRWSPGIYQRTDFNSRLQIEKSYADNGSTVLLNLKYNYFPQNNGNISSIDNLKDAYRSVAFSYDWMNRLKTAESGQNDCSPVPGTNFQKSWGSSFTYDPWGNLLAKNVTKCLADPLSVSVNGNNQIIGKTYDVAGNLTIDGTTTYAYDAEGRLTSTAGWIYTYDANGMRARKESGSNWKEYLYFNGEVIAEKDPAGWTEYVFYGGKRIARRDPTGTLHYYLADQLGTARMVVSPTGTIEEDSDFYPFGGERAYVDTLSNQQYKFTGKERDSESGADYFGARYYLNVLGRWGSPDPLLSSGTPDSPQTWNRYSYVLNNPLSFIDPTGLWEWDASAGGTQTDAQLEQASKDKKLSRKQRKAASNALAFRARFRKAVAAAKAAAATSGNAEAQSAVSAYGTEGDGNKVNVGWRNTQRGSSASALLEENDSVTVKFNKNLDGNKLAVVVAHEGMHAYDALAWVAAGHPSGGTFDLDHDGRESRGWQVSGLVAQFLGMKNYGPSGGGPEMRVWNKGWKQADVGILRSRGVAEILKYMSNAPSTYSQEHNHR